MAPKKKSQAAERARQRKRLARLAKRGQSDLIEVRNSPIHGRGVYAAQDIDEGQRIVEYVGELIDKEEGERRAWAQSEQAEKTGEAAVYIFNLNEKWDLDGNLDLNPARLINHSCEPNCEAFTEKRRIFIYALRDITAGEELSFDYGFELETWADHPCLCGSPHCVGHIVSQDHWEELAELKAAASADDNTSAPT